MINIPGAGLAVVVGELRAGYRDRETRAARDSAANRTSGSICVFPRSRMGSSRSRENLTNKSVWAGPASGFVVFDATAATLRPVLPPGDLAEPVMRATLLSAASTPEARNASVRNRCAADSQRRGVGRKRQARTGRR